MLLTVAVPSRFAELRGVRDVVSSAVASWGVPVERSLLELLLSEVLTNAMEHGEPPISVSLDWDGQRLRVAVADSSPDQPVHRAPDPHDTAGRGIWLLEHIASAWGVDGSPDGTGKSVWFELRSGRS